MPLHDWTRVIAGQFHDFHHRWITKISEALNFGLLPKDYYALAEQYAGRPQPDVIALERTTLDEELLGSSTDWEHEGSGTGGTATLAQVASVQRVEQQAPEVRYVDEIQETDEAWYAAKGNRIGVYHANGHRVVAYIEIVSAGNKDRPQSITAFGDKLDEALTRGVHLLVLDLLPPGPHDSDGMHAAYWSRHSQSVHGVNDQEPSGLSAYRSDVVDGRLRPTAYFQPVAIGTPLPPMPLFLTPHHYINIPLEQTYSATWSGVPAYWREVIEGRREHRVAPRPDERDKP